MGTHRKKWTTAEKLAIIKYYSENGMSKTIREYNISSTSVYKWKSQHNSGGEKALEKAAIAKSESAELKQLRRENDELKKIVAEKELRLRIQSEMLKKSNLAKKNYG